MMRQMTPGELHAWYVRGEWPCGHGNQYIPGPRGGLSRNIQCPKCGMKLNVVDPDSGYGERGVHFGQVIEEHPFYKPPPLPLAARIARWFTH